LGVIKGSSRKIKTLGKILLSKVHQNTVFEIPQGGVVVRFIFKLGG
jgi:hypothetical protein